MAASAAAVPMPRSFKLLDELDMERMGKNPFGVSLGLMDEDDTAMGQFTGSIIVPAGSSGLVDRFLSLTVIPPPDYPVAAPTLRFNSKVNIPGVVDASGAVDPRRVPKLAAWTPTSNIVEALAELQQIARNAPSAQPRDGETY
ncbi:hypothetical protein FNF27_01106 [Cafeteria roenbergensis]|uniref:UBC core domain-containing protein n=1 Tax=Cafeteria roenbergensis TaxID=33653 RepID=A0A5A8EJG2_CAFRO|nr:hypothetical protein FNF31_06382 [Cafeteria roenbergensis]KAA0156753.1 hypothetical protein FNF29_00864 [Cafeteria roenbergensis]KAA0164298.1 hypothetical protein FNF28_03929 [Cafeteria roenbergensis]KAA0177328.1 hypothetical protein FNF27_01106 [Cafeteria roenbergensis]|eukprot:KAA0156753.1 hypothetical protein FNF29_00864 [Cafeteria roenbergensis]